MENNIIFQAHNNKEQDSHVDFSLSTVYHNGY